MKVTEITKGELKAINAGREVYKYDTNGDGRWNIKVVIRNNGTIRVKGRN